MMAVMRLWYGSYGLPLNGASTTSDVRTEFSYSGRPLRYVCSVEALVYIDGDGQSDLTTKENAFRAALSVPYLDLILRQDSGAASSTYLLNAGSMSGVRITDGPHFQNEAKDGEFVCVRTARFTAEATYLYRGTENAVVSFRESVSITGNGGPRRSWRFPVNAPARRQVITPYSLVTATQSGEMVGHTRQPPPRLPIWPDYLVNDRSGTKNDSPRPLGQAVVDFGISWNFVFERGDGPLIGVPGLPPL